jgi:hypothetical protein
MFQLPNVQTWRPRKRWPDSKRHLGFLASQLPRGSPVCLRPFVEARAKDAASPFLRTHYRCLAEEYRLRAKGELRVSEREGLATAEATGT